MPEETPEVQENFRVSVTLYRNGVDVAAFSRPLDVQFTPDGSFCGTGDSLREATNNLDLCLRREIKLRPRGHGLKVEKSDNPGAVKETTDVLEGCHGTSAAAARSAGNEEPITDTEVLEIQQAQERLAEAIVRVIDTRIEYAMVSLNTQTGFGLEGPRGAKLMALSELKAALIAAL